MKEFYFPDKINSFVSGKPFSVDETGMSDSSVLIFDDLVLKIQPIENSFNNEHVIMNWLEYTVLTTTEASDMISNLLIEAGSKGVMIEDKNDVAINQRPEGQWDIIHEEIARRIGDDVTVGHGAILHGCTIGNNTLIGMGAVVLNDAVIGDNCIVGARALVTGGKVFPAGSLIMGVPAKVVRPLTEEEMESNRTSAEHYVRSSREVATHLAQHPLKER